MNKLIEVSDTKAYQIQTLLINNVKCISIRQMYATKKNPEFMPGRQGITIPYDDTGKTVVKALVRCFKEEQKFKVLELKNRGNSSDDDSDDEKPKKKSSKKK